MKNKTPILLLLVMMSSVAYATTETATEPVVLKAEDPLVFAQEAGRVVTLRIELSETGIPTAIEAVRLNPYDRYLADRLIESVYQWEFAPALDRDGLPKKSTVELPVRIGDGRRS